MLGVAADARTAAVQQRILIRSTDTQYAFALTPLGRGRLRRDSGTITWDDPRHRVVKRNGQSIEIDVLGATFTGDRGTFVLRFRTEWTNPGRGYTIGTSTWTFVSGTGPYSPIRGGGGGASIWPPKGFPFFRLEGLVHTS